MTDLSQIVYFDLESDLIRPGYQLPEPVVASTYHAQDGVRVWLHGELPRLVECLFSDPSVRVCGHNITGFDLPALAAWFPEWRPQIWRMLEEDRAYDTQTAERIIQIQRGAAGPLALDVVQKGHGIDSIDKAEWREIRLSFGQFKGATELPDKHREYVTHDVVNLPELFSRQLKTQLVDLSDLCELGRQTFAMALVSARGFRTDPERVRQLENMLGERLDELEAIAREQGFLKTAADGEVSRNMSAIHEAIAHDYAPDAVEAYRQWRADAHAWYVEGGGKTMVGKRPMKPETWQKRAETCYSQLQGPRLEGTTYGGPAPDYMRDPRVPVTDAGNVRADRLTLEDASSPQLQALSEWGQLLSIRNKDLPIFYRGAGEPIHSRVGITNTSRVSTSNPNCQNMGKMAGVRECIVARPGYALGATDFSMLELVSLAQLCVERLGLTTMADKINAGIDMHAEIGADVLGVTYEEIVARRKAGDPVAKAARDSGKPANFGLNGGMSDIDTYQLYARKSYGQVMTREQCEAVVAAWQKRAVDQQAWLRHQRTYRNAQGLYDICLPRFNNIWRYGLKRTEASNNPFQVLGMRVAARALWKVAKAQYCLPPSHPDSMAGSHLVLFVHDDLTSEMPLDKAEEHLAIQERLMCEASREVCPAVFAGVESTLTSHLSKAPKGEKDEFGVVQVQMPAKLKA